MVVHQLLSAAGPVDAVTGQARAYRRAFEAWGWGGSDHAALIDPRMGRWIRPLEKLDPAPDDVLLLHYSAYAPRLRPLLALPNRKLLVSHNITPARYLWSHEPVVAVYCSVGREQLPEFARSVDVAAGAHATAQARFRAAGVDPATHEFVTADAFAFLRQAHEKGTRWDLVVSDPPSFAPSEKALPRALSAYRGLHRACAISLRSPNVRSGSGPADPIGAGIFALHPLLATLRVLQLLQARRIDTWCVSQ